MSRTAVRGDTGARIAVAVSLVMVAAMAVGCSDAPRPAPVTRVVRGTVANKVQASGALAAVTSQNLGFPKGAQLKEVDVKVGDRVQPGQVLARVDDFAFNQALAQQQAQLNQQQAGLNKIVGSNSVHAAQETLAQAKKILSATKDNVDAQDDADSSAIDRARTQLNFDRSQLDQASRQAAGCQPGSSNSSDTSSSTPTSSSPTSTPSAPDEGSADLAIRGWRSRDSSTDPSASSEPTPSWPSRRTSSSGTGLTSGTGASSGTQTSGTCTTENQAVSSAQRQVISSQTALDAARRTRDVDQSAGKLSVENARQSVVSAQNTLDSANTDRPSDIQGQAAVVANARAAVALAQRDVDNAVLYAPVGGTVSAINGSVGEFVGSANSGTTALAPGTDASIPGVGAAATSDAAGSNGPSATRPGGSAFVVLNDINTFQIVVPFEESDAVKVAANQPVDVTFDAVPDLTRRGTVLSVAPGGVNISGVTNYYATILLNESDPRLRDGLTAETAVLTNALNNVLVVPNAAVLRQGLETSVNIPGPDGTPVRVPFRAGAVGDDTTQVLSGLREGQPILTPEAQVSPGAGTGVRGGGGRGGGSGGAGNGGAGNGGAGNGGGGSG
jgi:HlyD family secretion protein